MSCGITADVVIVEKGYASQYMFAAASGGVNNIVMTVMSWGDRLQQRRRMVLHSADSVVDAVTTKLGYWTDTEAYYGDCE